MPLSCAAQWIATHGNTLDPASIKKAEWRLTYRKLVGAIASGKISVIGYHRGLMEPIEPNSVRSLPSGLSVDH